MSFRGVNRAAFAPALCPELCQKSNAGSLTRASALAGLDGAIHPFSKDSLRRVMDTRVKPAYDEIRMIGFAPE